MISRNHVTANVVVLSIELTMAAAVAVAMTRRAKKAYV